MSRMWATLGVGTSQPIIADRNIDSTSHTRVPYPRCLSAFPVSTFHCYPHSRQAPKSLIQTTGSSYDLLNDIQASFYSLPPLLCFRIFFRKYLDVVFTKAFAPSFADHVFSFDVSTHGLGSLLTFSNEVQQSFTSSLIFWQLYHQLFFWSLLVLRVLISCAAL